MDWDLLPKDDVQCLEEIMEGVSEEREGAKVKP